MVSILDVAPVPEIVRVRGVEIPVNGLSLEDLAALVARFPEIAGFFADGAEKGAGPMAFLKASPGLAAMVIGAATGQDSPEEIAGFRKLPFGDSLALLLAVKRGSLPDGSGPLEELMAMLEPVITKWVAIVVETIKARSMASAAQPPSSSAAAATDTPTS